MKGFWLWSGYFDFFVFWFSVGWLVITLNREIFFPDMLPSFARAIDIGICILFFHNIVKTAKCADLRDARKENERWREIYKQLFP